MIIFLQRDTSMNQVPPVHPIKQVISHPNSLQVFRTDFFEEICLEFFRLRNTHTDLHEDTETIEPKDSDHFCPRAPPLWETESFGGIALLLKFLTYHVTVSKRLRMSLPLSDERLNQKTSDTNIGQNTVCGCSHPIAYNSTS